MSQEQLRQHHEWREWNTNRPVSGEPSSRNEPRLLVKRPPRASVSEHPEAIHKSLRA